LGWDLPLEPQGIGDELNWYAYGEGSPLTEVDVDGLGCGGKKQRKNKIRKKPNRRKHNLNRKKHPASKKHRKKRKFNEKKAVEKSQATYKRASEEAKGSKKTAASDGDNTHGITVTNRKTSMKSMNDQELTKLSKRGDKEATYEKNRRKMETATQSGDPKNLKNAHGAAIENKIADELGEDVVKAGEEVKYPNPSNPNRTLKSEIDLETQTEVIQIKSGQDLPDPRQTATTLSHAQQTGKTPVVYYNANEVPKRAVEQYKKDYPAIKLVPRDDFSFINP